MFVAMCVANVYVCQAIHWWDAGNNMAWDYLDVDGGAEFGNLCGDPACLSVRKGEPPNVEYISPAGFLKLPDKIDGKPVVNVGEGAFKNCTGLTGVSVPKGVKQIKKLAFMGCIGLSEVQLPEGLMII